MGTLISHLHIGRTMKVIILCLLLGTTLGAPGSPTFEEFEEKYHHNYTDAKAEATAKEEFEKHKAQVEQNNADYEAGKSHYKEKIVPWDDLTDEEFKKEKTGLIPTDDKARATGLIPTPEHERINTPEEIAFLDRLYAEYDRADIPDTWDSRTKGWVTSVQDQEGCGSCAAFAAIAAAESSLLKAGADPSTLDLSEQWLLDCKPEFAEGCAGARLRAYPEYLAKTGNLMHEKDRPYDGAQAFYDQCPSGPYWSPGYKIKYLIQWDSKDHGIMVQVMEFGATVVALAAGEDGFVHYDTGVFDTCMMTADGYINHAVVVVGWGTENNIPYWLIKNSWGTLWGDDGYIKVKRGTCGINKYVSTAFCVNEQCCKYMGNARGKIWNDKTCNEKVLSDEKNWKCNPSNPGNKKVKEKCPKACFCANPDYRY